MAERIDNLKYRPAGPGTTTFMDGPGEFLVKAIVDELKKVPQFATILGEAIDPYRRMDYSIRSLPALRVYNETYRKTSESWFIEGDIKVDLIWPASVRRTETQQYQDSLAAAIIQQMRRPAFFEILAALVPGLNEMAREVSVDKTLGFEWNETVVPLTQMTLNFKLDLRAWDDYLEQTGRTKDTPFAESLEDLSQVQAVIQGLRDDLAEQVEIVDQTV